MDFIQMHWEFIEKLVKETNALVIAPAYRVVPFGTYKEAYDLIVPVYKKYCEDHPEKKIIMMGDSAGGGLALALAEYFKKEGIRLPDELILYSPWVDISMENEEIKEYIPREPLLEAGTIWPAAKGWAADLDLHDPLVSPIYGDLKGLRNVTVFLGTEEILYPDVTKMFHMLDADVSNELIVGEEMFHCYPLAPIEEAKREETYRIFVTKSLQLIPQNKYITQGYEEFVKPQNTSHEAHKSGGQIAAEVIKNAGLNFGV